MKYDDLNLLLAVKFPELATAIESEIKKNDNEVPSCYILYPDVFVPYMKSIIQVQDKQKLEHIFVFFEELALCDDERVKSFLQVALLEELWGNKKIYKVALQYMMPTTRQINENIKNYLKMPT